MNFHLWETLNFGLLNNEELNEPECKFYFFMKNFTYLTSSTKNLIFRRLPIHATDEFWTKELKLKLNSFFTKSKHFPTVVLQKLFKDERTFHQRIEFKSKFFLSIKAKPFPTVNANKFLSSHFKSRLSFSNKYFNYL